MNDTDRCAFLQRFTDAWNLHDVDALMAMMTEDAVFASAAGGLPGGAVHRGRKAVRQASAALFETYHDARWDEPRHWAHGERGVSEWTFHGTDPEGRRVVVRGCDLFTFRHGLIALKDSFRKSP